MSKKPGNNPVDEHVGGKVRMRRMMLGMSQTELAEGLGVTFQQVQKYEKGVNRISAGRLQQITNILKVPTAFFFEDVSASNNKGSSGSAADGSLINAFVSCKDGLALVTAYMAIKDKTVRKRVVELVVQVSGS